MATIRSSRGIIRRQPAPNSQAEAFLKVASQFRLGDLPTEQFHPQTADLSRLARSNPEGALRLLHRVDAEALKVLLAHLNAVLDLARRIDRTLREGGRVYLAGCGSTGRLVLTCEALWRRVHAGAPLAERVIAFMAGGDSALVRAVEGFEDHADYGARQLEENGFRNGDLLVAASEGGETPFVIGAVLHAAHLSEREPCFLYCNPDAVLARTAERSAQVLANLGIAKFSFPTGPMALSGSTRMQASTVLMAAIGTALLDHGKPRRIPSRLEALLRCWKRLNTRFLTAFVAAEADLYGAGENLDYVADPDLAITVLTDTTERSPTFSFPPFEHVTDGPYRNTPCHLVVPEAADSENAWWMILGRSPRGLGWPELGGRASIEHLLGYDFSRRHLERTPSITHAYRHAFTIRAVPEGLEFRLDAIAHHLRLPGLDPFSTHLVLKMVLNAHSTMVMGRLGRFDGNVMTWVKASNHKLVDRAVRYAARILLRQGITVPYADLARACFDLRDRVPRDQPLVHALVRRFKASRTSRRRPAERKKRHGPALHA